MNKVFILGRLTDMTQSRKTPNDVAVTTFSVAVTRRFNRNETDFINVVTWRALAENCAKYLVKGQQVAVVGELRTRSYDAKDGSKRYVTEVQADDVEFLSRPNGQGGDMPAQRAAAPAPESDPFASEMSGVFMEEEDLPF